MQVLINLDVDDMSRAVDFYTRVFDLRVGRRLGASVTELLGSSAPIYLLQKAPGTTAAPGTARSRHYDRHWTPVHLDFVVDDLDAAVEKALAAGATREAPVTTQVWGRLALMADPFGHGYCFVQFLGRGYDAIATG